jgi:glycosyltransferase involved in cell wall biosynthesis
MPSTALENEKTRIALVTASAGLGGSTTFLCNLAGELVRRSIPTQVLSFEQDNPLASDFERLGVPILCLDDRRMIFEDRMKIILQNLKQFQPGMVLANLGAVSFEVLRYLPSGVFRIGIAQSDDPLVYEMIGHYAGHLDLLAVVSETMRRKAAAMPEFAGVPVRCLSYGVPMYEDTELPARDFTKPLRIIYHGRLGREQKRTHLFPEILRHLKTAGIPFHWTIAGDGGGRGFLEANMKTTTPRQTVSIIGPVPYSEVPALLKQHDICLLASDYEGFGLGVAEAMGCGLVPVVSDLPAGIPEMVDATTGILVQVNDVAGYARAIVHLHEHRDELAAKSAAARARVKTKFSVAAMADRWLAVLPQNSPAISRWPDDWKIQPPLAVRHPVYYSPPVRVLRRLAKKFRQ